MASTPPPQIRATVPTPSTPLHGAAHDNPAPVPRYPTRFSQRRISRESLVRPKAAQLTPKEATPAQTPHSLRPTSPQPHPLELPQLSSPATSPNRRSSRRVQVISPCSPDFVRAEAEPSSHISNSRAARLSSTINMTEGMLPTPAKTPSKKSVPNVKAAARALFQDQPILGEEVEPPSRRSRKARRYNGFSLESFSVGDGVTEGRVHIYTDSRDNIPQLDRNEDNPFIDHQEIEDAPSTKKVTGTSKRRKISGEVKKDSEVEEAIKNDQGMVYVFRGKKVFRKFDDNDDEEEEIDAEDLGLLKHDSKGLAISTPMKTLTRKSVKPTRLFQTHDQKRSREAEKEEEAVTDIEDESNHHNAIEGLGLDAPAESIEATEIHEAPMAAEPPAIGRSLRSATKKDSTETSNGDGPVVEKVRTKTLKKSSPFDSWKRVKAGSSLAPATFTKSRKRAAPDVDANINAEINGRKAKAQKAESSISGGGSPVQ